jgi:hypothetical protein
MRGLDLLVMGKAVAHNSFRIFRFLQPSNLRNFGMGTLLQPQKQIKSVALSQPPKSRLKGDSVASFQARCASALRLALPKELKAHGAVMPMVDVDAMAESLARQMAQLADAPASQGRGKAQVPPANDWISTQEAANRCGFSRPFVAALLDSGTYAGKVHRTAGGHRKVLASEFEALVAKASAAAPKTLAHARKAVDLTRLDEASATVSKARKQSKARADALAKKLGLTA